MEKKLNKPLNQSKGKMNIIEIKNKNKLNNFLRSKKDSCFLQSWDWGEYQKQNGFEIKRLGVEDGGELKASALLIKNKLPFGNYFYCPKGPVFKEEIINKKEEIIKFFKEIKKQESVIFLRLEPKFQIPNSKFQILKTIDIQPSKTIILDLNKTEEELLKEMHQKTRYNIRLAEKKGVKIREAKITPPFQEPALSVSRMGGARGGSDDFDKFWALMEQTVKRDGFSLHPKKHYQEMININHKYLKIFLAEFEGKVISAGIFSLFGDTVTYMHGASSNEHRNVMSPYLLHWHVIKLVKSWGFKKYDFFGIDEKKWPGVTRFKKGFGGEEINYPGTFDLVFNKPLYIIYKLGRIIRRLV